MERWLCCPADLTRAHTVRKPVPGSPARLCWARVVLSAAEEAAPTAQLPSPQLIAREVVGLTLGQGCGWKAERAPSREQHQSGRLQAKGREEPGGGYQKGDAPHRLAL